jgi:hypothetical protein
MQVEFPCDDGAEILEAFHFRARCFAASELERDERT